jgi:hypothetical protein
MLKQLLIIILLSISTTFFAQVVQKNDSVKKPIIIQEVQDTVKTVKKLLVELKAIVVSDNISKPLQNANVIDLDNLKGVSTDDDGKFTLEVSVGDKLLISYLGYQSLQLFVTQDMVDIVNSKIIMRVKPFEIAEVTVSSYKLIGVLETDSKFIPTHTAYDVDTRGLPNQGVKLKKYDASKVINNPLNAIFHPVDFLYSMFGSKPKQMRKLRKMKEQDAIQTLLESRYDREVIMLLLEVQKEELDDILNSCHYSDYFIQNANDLQFLDAVLDCYQSYKITR